jgi:hypothetical protein
MTTHIRVWVVASSDPFWKSTALTANSEPDTRYVPAIIFFRPSVSNSGPRIRGPSRFPIEKARP